MEVGWQSSTQAAERQERVIALYEAHRASFRFQTDANSCARLRPFGCDAADPLSAPHPQAPIRSANPSRQTRALAKSLKKVSRGQAHEGIVRLDCSELHNGANGEI